MLDVDDVDDVDAPLQKHANYVKGARRWREKTGECMWLDWIQGRQTCDANRNV